MKQNNEVIWKDVIGFEGLYKVSNMGEVFSCRTGKILSQHVHVPFPKRRKGDRYLKVDLHKDNKHTRHFVHRLVLNAFLPPLPFSGFSVNHKDGNWRNNKLSNLEWSTVYDQMFHKKVVINKKRRKIK